MRISQVSVRQRWLAAGHIIRKLMRNVVCPKALDRDGQLSKFSFSDFAVVEATPAQGKSQEADANEFSSSSTHACAAL